MPCADWPSVLRLWNASSPNERTLPSLKAIDPHLLAGIAAYRRHGFVRTMPHVPVLWQEGSARLLDYGDPGDPPLLIVPSLVNRAYILDLLPGHSMVRSLAARGIRPVLLDWGFPDEAERRFSLSDLIAGRLLRAIAAIGRPLTLAGYCMGGLMAVAAAQLCPDLVDRLVLLATPWDFQADDPAEGKTLAALLPLLEPGMAHTGALATDMLQILFSLLDPGGVGAKYRDFATQDPAGQRAEMFVAMEDWLNDGIPLAAPVAREVIGDWYGWNTPARGMWHVLGTPILPQSIRVPAFVAIPARDRIVKPRSAQALARLLPGAEVIVPNSGHVGMVAGSSARTQLWDKLFAWLAHG
jgi:poly(3-hydroxyalkanoate) synthetase